MKVGDSLTVTEKSNSDGELCSFMLRNEIKCIIQEIFFATDLHFPHIGGNSLEGGKQPGSMSMTPPFTRIIILFGFWRVLGELYALCPCQHMIKSRATWFASISTSQKQLGYVNLEEVVRLSGGNLVAGRNISVSEKDFG